MMEMKKDLSERINRADIPELLKDYLLRNKQMQLSFNSSLLDDIEDLYIEYDSLYSFDEAEFSAYVITGLKKQDKHNYFYNYLKIVMQSNISLISKDRSPNYEVLKRMDENISRETDNIPVSTMTIFNLIEDYKKSKNIDLLFIAHKLSGNLEIMFTLYPGNKYSRDYKKACDLLGKLTIDK